MIRTISSGDLGLDVLLGGGWRLVQKLPERESTTVLVRGGSGAGKTIVGFHVALELARELGGDVAVGCVEILPREYVAQLQSARPSLAAARVTEIPLRPTSDEGPRVFVGLLPDMEPGEPDLVAGLENLARDVEAAGGKPVAFVVDSLIEGYGIGLSAPRLNVDAVMKFAAQGGHGLVLCEEVVSDTPSPWVFSADTVLQLGVESRERGRWVEVRKHRFGPSASGRHELDLVGSEHPQIYPAPHAWLSSAIDSTLATHGWQFGGGEVAPVLAMANALSWKNQALEGQFVFISGDGADVARGLANSIHLQQRPRGRTLLLELDPLAQDEHGESDELLEAHWVPSTQGASRALRAMFELLGRARAGAGSAPDRVLIGDLGLVLGAPDGGTWSAAVHALAAVMLRTRWRVPLIAYDGRAHANDHAAHLAAQADISIRTQDDPITRGKVLATFAQRSPRWTSVHGWSRAEISRAQSTLDQVMRARR